MDLVVGDPPCQTLLHHVLGIDWSAFTWEAFATLATGAMAVAGAVWVGLRQVGIAHQQVEIGAKQTAIMEQQTHLGELTLRHDLFERRTSVYQAVNAFLAHVMRHADYPERDIEAAFVQAMLNSRFLFPERVYEGLQEIWEHMLSFRALKSTMKATYEAEGHYGDGNPEREEQQLLWLVERLQTLPNLFGEEMRLA